MKNKIHFIKSIKNFILVVFTKLANLRVNGEKSDSCIIFQSFCEFLVYFCFNINYETILSPCSYNQVFSVSRDGNFVSPLRRLQSFLRDMSSKLITTGLERRVVYPNSIRISHVQCLIFDCKYYLSKPACDLIFCSKHALHRRNYHTLNTSSISIICCCCKEQNFLQSALDFDFSIYFYLPTVQYEFGFRKF